jgi:2-methylcitrate dehydratase PrpD
MPVLSGFVAGAADRPLPPAVATKTTQHILNTLACMISGTTLPPGRLAIEMVRGYGGAPHASIPGTDLLAVGEIAAFANGMTARGGESDDVHARSRAHPGASIVPAALAMAEREGASGERLVRAVCAGYDVGCRIVPGLGLAHLEDRGFGPHAFGQLWGAAVAAGVVAGVTERQARHLLSYAAQQTGGLASWVNDEGHCENSFFMGGRPARDGYWAAAMVAAGFTANPDVLAGRYTFQDTFSDTADPREFVNGLGERHEVMETSLKRWHVGAPIHASLEALLALREQHGLAAEGVARVTAHVPARDGVIVQGRHAPNVDFHHVLAVALLDGGLSLAATHDAARMRDPRAQALAGRIAMVLDDDLQKLMPTRTAIVEVLTKDGRRLRHRTDAVLGTPAAPMTQAQVEEVARELVAPVLGDRRAGRLIAAVRDLERVADVRSLRPLLSLSPSGEGAQGEGAPCP